MTDLESRVFIAIAKATPTTQPAAVLAEIRKTHVIGLRSDVTVVALGDLIEKAEAETTATGSVRRFELGSALIDGLRALEIKLVDDSDS